MSNDPRTDRQPAGPVAAPVATADGWVQELNQLLQQLETVVAAGQTLPPVLSETADEKVVRVRLGVAASLFAALRCKHPATAGHSLRVALTCSAWVARLGLPAESRDAVEIAALLHDVGAIGAPDAVLLKPGALSAEEAAIMARSRKMSIYILRHSCSQPEILRIVENVSAWYDGSRPGYALRGEDLPVGARMIAIAEAFDAMTTDHVFRPAMSQERALVELFQCAGRQFDPLLVRSFAELLGGELASLHKDVANRWLQTLDPELVDSYWELNCVPSSPGAQTHGVDALFQAKLLENMYDAVLFIDVAGSVVLWNRGAERLTGIVGNSIRHRQWAPELLQLADERGNAIGESDCPVYGAIRSGVQSLRRLTLAGRGGRTVSVDTHAIPVSGPDGHVLGAILLFHDASSETTLEQRCQTLNEKATRDPLTQVANRAEFDRVLSMFVAAHQQQQVPCSLVMCDIDRFKSVNDSYGHQAGDEAIKTLAALLKSACRPGDLVARYGGEEFVVLCADCDNATAARRAEQMRKSLAQVSQPMIGGRAITASFGVTEIQPGDTPETMLRRADRALLMAKDRGRNNVVQLGTGSRTQAETPKRGFFWSWQPNRPAELLEQTLVTAVPVKIAIEKLRGFVADHEAAISKIDGNLVTIEIAEKRAGGLKRLTDRPVMFNIQLQFAEEPVRHRDDPRLSSGTRTRIRIIISPHSNRDRRRTDLLDRARQMLASFRAYLMANDEDQDSAQEMPEEAAKGKRSLLAWLGLK